MIDTHNKNSGWLLLATALSLSVGWGIRGNFGHEYGAMIPGALATMAGALLAGRADWWPRVGCFGLFGALGWSFGGSISYMQVIAYTHSGHSLSVYYGFACLFLIGFLWAAMGGAGAGLAACLNREQLHSFFVPLTTVFAAWAIQDATVNYFERTDPQFRHVSPLYWFDTDWLAALVALVAILALVLVRRRWDAPTSLIVHMAIGWWAGFLLLVVTLGWRMTPPRGDNWAGCTGMVIGLWIFLQRYGWFEVTLASAVTGFIGGLGFATATMLKLVEVRSGLQTNWHSILEQTYGLINGLGLGLAILWLARRTKPQETEPAVTLRTQVYSSAFVLFIITYVNLRKNPAVWVEAKAMPAVLYGLSAEVWFDLSYGILTLAGVAALISRARQLRQAGRADSAGEGLILYLFFLWWMVLGNFARALVSFTPQRLVTEGVIHLNAVICSWILLTKAFRVPQTPVREDRPVALLLRRTLVVGLVILVGSVTVDWMVVRTLYGDTFAGHATRHIRFGPNATASKERPDIHRPHP